MIQQHDRPENLVNHLRTEILEHLKYRHPMISFCISLLVPVTSITIMLKTTDGLEEAYLYL